MSFESAFEQVKQLVEDFKTHEKQYLSPEYSEAQVRKDFIDKFFIALGWDVNHDIQKNPYEQEVKVEKNVKVGTAQKKADYSFSLSPNFTDSKFYVEAKKPSKSLKKADDYFQAVRYGWNSQHSVAVLTDFEEFHIIDSRFKPDVKTSIDRCIQQYHYSQYTIEEKFRKIYHLFSREDVSKGSLDRFADLYMPKPKKNFQKGLFKGGFQQVDDSFLKELDEIREVLARAIKKSNPSFTGEVLTETVQRIIDRLVFIRFLEDKLIEPEHIIDGLGSKGDLWKEFISESRKLDTKYNGLVFKKHLIDELDFKPPAYKIFEDICNDLSHVNSPYNFAQIPIHILGSIYERFLGKVVSSTSKMATIEEKPEVRKSGGVYYTPQYIVDYIVQNTIKEFIEGKSPNEISKMSFADISCGSGSFLITVFDTLIRYHGKWFNNHPDEAKKAGCKYNDEKGTYGLRLHQKQQILLNNIYGVDIDYQAVEVTQLSLFLKLLEDETMASADEQLVMMKEKLLPDLSRNIICGNSLIGTDIYEGNLFPTEEEKKINAMNFEDRFPDIMKKGGFDVVLGNPPWGQKAVKFSNIEKQYLLKTYPSSIIGILDFFRFFIEKSTKLIRQRGYFGLVLPDILLLKQYDSTRKLILEQHKIKKIDYWGMVFESVNLDVISIISEINSNNKTNSIEVYIHNEDKPVEKKIHQSLFRELDGFKFNLFLDAETKNILDKFKLYTKFGDLFIIREGIHSGNIRGKLFIPENINPFCKRLIFGRDEIKRYFLKWQGMWANYKKELIDKEKGEYAGLGKPEYFENDKIVVRRTGDFVLANIDTEGYYFSNNVFVCIPQGKDIDLFYILGILNSKLMTWFYRKIQPRKGKLFSELKINQLSQFPIKICSDKNKIERLTKLVKEIIKTNKLLYESKIEKDKNLYESKFKALDNEINNHVYSIYKLNNREIKLIENSN